MITISPAKHNRCRDLSFRCFSIILNKKNDILFFDPENFGEVLAINDKSIIFYYSWIWEESYGDVYHAVRLSDWQVFGKEKDSGSEVIYTEGYDYKNQITPTPEIEELFQ